MCCVIIAYVARVAAGHLMERAVVLDKRGQYSQIVDEWGRSELGGIEFGHAGS